MVGLCALLTMLLTSCTTLTTDRADDCGYTWFRATAPARVVTIHHAPDWRDYPGRCREFGIRGCATRHVMSDGALWAEIRLRFPAEAWHACSTLEHELRHAAGWDHREIHQYVPTDITRR